MWDQKNILLICPPYDEKSNGIIIFYSLVDYLCELNYNVKLYPVSIDYFKNKKSTYPYKYQSKFITSLEVNKDTTLCILPDSISYSLSKKLKFKWRAWYFLNKPLFLSGEPLHYYENDVFLSYSYLISKNDFQFFLNTKTKQLNSYIELIKSCKIRKKNFISVYYGKSRSQSYIKLLFLKIISFGFIKIIVLNRIFPENKNDLYKILSTSRLLISFDPMSNIIYEAAICKTPVYIADNYYGINYKTYNVPLIGISDKIRDIFQMYVTGIPKKQWLEMISSYHNSINNHLTETSKAIDYIKNEFSRVDKLSPNQKKIRIQERLRDDVAEFKKYKKNLLSVKPSLSHYRPNFSLRTFILLLFLSLLKIYCDVLVKLRLIDAKFHWKIANLIEDEKTKVIGRRIGQIPVQTQIQENL